MNNVRTTTVSQHVTSWSWWNAVCAFCCYHTPKRLPWKKKGPFIMITVVFAFGSTLTQTNSLHMKTINCMFCGSCEVTWTVFSRDTLLDTFWWCFISASMVWRTSVRRCSWMDGYPTTIRWTVVKCVAHSHVPPAGWTVTTLAYPKLFVWSKWDHFSNVCFLLICKYYSYKEYGRFKHKQAEESLYICLSFC